MRLYIRRSQCLTASLEPSRQLCCAGEAAAAKTQLAMQLMLQVQLAPQYGGLDGSAM